MKKVCGNVYISCRKDQAAPPLPYETIYDQYENIGPAAGVLSAFQFNSTCAWLVVACDFFLLDQSTLSELLHERNASYIATAFESPGDGMPEPALAIWEPASYPVVLRAVERGETSLRRIRVNNAVKTIGAKNNQALANVNTPAELKNVERLL